MLGFQAAYSHEVVDIDACPVLAHGLSAAIGPIKSMLRACAQYLGIRQVQLCEGDEVSALLIEADRPFAQAQQPQWQACMHGLSRQSGRLGNCGGSIKKTCRALASLYMRPV